MKQEDFDQCKLPSQRTGWIVHCLAKVSVWQILLLGIAAYVLPVQIISAVEYWCSPPAELAWIKAGEVGVTEFWNLVYFNFITILTIGYGDYAPHGFGARLLSIVEALTGTGVMTVTLAMSREI